jgi:hypothetical protein
MVDEYGSSGDFRDSPLFQALLADAHNIEEDLRVFNAEYRGFIERDDIGVGSILRCHLIVEHFMSDYLSAANPSVDEWGSARLTFAQKLALVDHPRSKVRLLIPSLRCLNSLRNRIAHRLDAELDHSAVGPIHEFMTIWNRAAGKAVPTGMQLVQEWALLASAWFHGDACMIRRHAPESGLLGLLAWHSKPGERARADDEEQ